MKTIPAECYFLIERDGQEIELYIEAHIIPGSPAKWTLNNGDPGYPADPAEVEITSASDQDGNEYSLTDDEVERIEEKLLSNVEIDYD